MVKIRKFSPSDINQIMAIDKVSFLKPWSKLYYKNLSKKHSNDFFVAEISGKVVGYVLGYKKRNGEGSIKTLAVAPEYRRLGTGKKLTLFIISNLKKRGVKNVFLHVRTKNQIANSFYKKLGFKVIKKIEKYFKNGDSAYLMNKKI